MKELMKKVFDEIDALVTSFIEMAKEAEKSGAINYQPLLKQQSECNKKLNVARDEAEERNKGKSKTFLQKILG